MTIDQRLSTWDSASASVVACRRIIALAVPARPGEDWSTFAQLATTRGASESERQLALAWCEAPEAVEAMAALDGLDEQDGVWANLEAAAGVIAALRSGGSTAGPLGDRQARDAMHKAFTLALVVERLFPGTPDQKLSRFLELQTGRVLIGLFGLVEVVLPFAQESSEEGLLSRIAVVHAESEMAVVVERLGPEAADRIAAVLPLLVEALEASVISRAADADAVLSSISDLAPGVMGLADRAGDVAAASVDLLPVYHLLGPRLVAEAAVQGQLLGPPEDLLKKVDDANVQIAEPVELVEPVQAPADQGPTTTPELPTPEPADPVSVSRPKPPAPKPPAPKPPSAPKPAPPRPQPMTTAQKPPTSPLASPRVAAKPIAAPAPSTPVPRKGGGAFKWVAIAGLVMMLVLGCGGVVVMSGGVAAVVARDGVVRPKPRARPKPSPSKRPRPRKPKRKR